MGFHATDCDNWSNNFCFCFLNLTIHLWCLHKKLCEFLKLSWIWKSQIKTSRNYIWYGKSLITCVVWPFSLLLWFPIFLSAPWRLPHFISLSLLECKLKLITKNKEETFVLFTIALWDQFILCFLASSRNLTLFSKMNLSLCLICAHTIKLLFISNY